MNPDEIFNKLKRVTNFQEDEEIPSFNLGLALDKDMQTDNVLDDSEIETFINDNKNVNTSKRTKADLSVFRRWCSTVNECRALKDIPEPELNIILCHFFLKVRKGDGTEYEPDTLTGFHRSFDRHLRENGKLCSILTDRMFQRSRETLEAKRKELRRAGKGRRPNKALGLTEEEVEKLWATKQLGSHSPVALLRTVWFNNTMHFGWRARDEHRRVQHGDLVLKREEGQSGREYVMWVTERGSKTRTGGKDSMPEHYFDPRMYATNTDRCPVKMFKTYIDRKPEPMKQPESPFYLAQIINLKSSVWYKASPLGVNSLGNFMKSMAVEAKLAGKHTNHSARRTMITTLRHENINPLDISQLSGHKNLKSIDTYSEASEEQQRRMSLAISGRSGGHVKPLEEKKQLNLQQSSSTESTTSAFAMLSGAVFNNCTITFTNPGNAAVGDNEQRSKRRRIVIESDEED